MSDKPTKPKRVRQVDKMGGRCLNAILEAFLATGDAIPYEINKELRRLTGCSNLEIEIRLKAIRKRRSYKIRLSDLEKRVCEIERRLDNEPESE